MNFGDDFGQGMRFGTGGWLRTSIKRSHVPSKFLTPALLLICLLGFALRVYRLDAQSLWFDEGHSIWTAQHDIISILIAPGRWEVHPPLYFYLLRWWMAATGASEYAVRFSSVVSGTVTIALSFWLARLLLKHVFNRGGVPALALISGPLLVAISPFLIYYSQEARHYGVLIMLGLASTGLLWKQLVVEPAGGTRRRMLLWGCYTFSITALMYIHYLGLFVAISHSMFVLCAGIRRFRLQVEWFYMALVSAFLYLPWLSVAWRQATDMARTPDDWRVAITVDWVLWRIGTALTAGRIPDHDSGGYVLGSIALALVGLVFLFRRLNGKAFWQVMALLLCASVGPIILLAGSLWVVPKVDERYVACSAPVMLIAAGLGAYGWSVPVGKCPMVLNRFVAILIAVVAVSLTLTATLQMYYAPRYIKDDVRGLAGYITQAEEPGDAIALLMDTSFPFNYYYHGSAELMGMHLVRDIDAAAAELESILHGKQRLWLALWRKGWADPSEYASGFLDETFVRLPVDRRFAGYDLFLYDVQSTPNYQVPKHPETRIDANFEDQIQLSGLDEPPKAVAAGAKVPLRLFWRLLHDTDDDLLISLRLQQAGAEVWRRQSRPSAYHYPTFYWQAGQLVLARPQVDIPADIAPGDYDIALVVYSAGQQRELDLWDAEKVRRGRQLSLGTIKVERLRRIDGLAEIANIAQTGRRLSSSLTLLDGKVETARVVPGQELPVSLRWLVTSTMTTSERLTAFIVDSSGQRYALREAKASVVLDIPAGSTASEIGAGRCRFFVPASVAPGTASIYLSTNSLDAASSPFSALLLGAVQVESRQRRFQASSPPGYATTLQVGQFARLTGYDLSADSVAAGGVLQITLHWQATDSAPANYTVFIHLLDAMNRVVAQQDSPPQGGRAPTAGWVAGEFIEDSYELRVPGDVPPGDYQIEVGAYDASTGARQYLIGLPGDGRADYAFLRPITLLARP
jgi:uncharacterized membrane protein